MLFIPAAIQCNVYTLIYFHILQEIIHIFILFECRYKFLKTYRNCKRFGWRLQLNASIKSPISVFRI